MRKITDKIQGIIREQGSLLIVLLYLLIGCLWVLFSDRLATRLTPSQAALATVSTVKGLGYVLLTGFLLYVLIEGNHRALRKVNRNYLLLAENISDVIVVVDLTTHRFTYISPSIHHLLGLAFDEVISQPIQKVLPLYVNDYARLLQSRADAFRQGEINHYTDELALNHKDGRQVWVEMTSSVGINPENHHVEMYATARDISQRKAAEAQIQMQLKRVSALNQIGRAIVASLNLHQTLDVLLSELRTQLNVDAASVYLFDDAAQLLDYATGIGFRRREKGKHQLRLNTGLAGVTAMRREVIHFPDLSQAEQIITRPDFLITEEFVEYFGIPLIAKGELKGVLEIFHRSHLTTGPDWMSYLDTLGGQAAIAIDNALLLSDLQRANTQLEQRVAERTLELSRVNAELSQANHAKDEFLANMSHELRTPLTAILGISESLLAEVAGPLNQRQEQYIELVDSSGRHLLGLINDILDLSKIEAGKLEPQFELAWIDEICQNSLILFRDTANKKEIALNYRCTPQTIQALVDPRRLKQMVVNLLSNAVKFTPAGGQVSLEVDAEAEQELLHIAVTDTGIGIASADLHRLFTPFTQVDSSLSRQQQGTGLGLALVRKLVELHNGGVSVESETGQGSRFTLTLPWIRSVQAVTPAPEPAPTLGQVLPTGPGRRILLAEDNTINAETTRDYLTAAGYLVAIARDGSEVPPLAEAFQPEILLIDIQMPTMDGLAAIRWLRQTPAFAGTPVVALTALAMPGDRERCLEAGANEYLSKPYRLKALVSLIESL